MRIVTGLGVGRYLRRKGVGNTVELDWWEVFDHAPHLRVHFVPAQHWSRRGAFDRPQDAVGRAFRGKPRGPRVLCR
jgi:L-ascorbate metabolism protein UlaG (beta-lactamase superfamily)